MIKFDIKECYFIKLLNHDIVKNNLKILEIIFLILFF